MEKMKKNDEKKIVNAGSKKILYIYTVKNKYYYSYYTLVYIYIDPIISDLILLYISLFFLMFIAR